MTTVTGYQYKDIRRCADFKYMHRPSSGSITNLWVKDYGCLQASGQTEYHKWEILYPEIKIIEPFIENINTQCKKVDDLTVEILGGTREFIFELLSDQNEIELGTDENRYKQPFPALKGYPVIIKVKPDDYSFLKNVKYKISIKD